MSDDAVFQMMVGAVVFFFVLYQVVKAAVRAGRKDSS